MSTAKIVSVEPSKTADGHRHWVNKISGKINYGFVMTLDNGDVGDCASEKTSYPLGPGTVITYEKKEKDSRPGEYNFTKIKKADIQPGNGNGNGTKSTYNDPMVVKKIAIGMCQSAAVAMVKYLHASVSSAHQINKLALYFSDWVLRGVDPTTPNYRDIISRKYYAITIAVECVPIPDMKVTTRERVIEVAEGFMEPFNMLDENASTV